MQAFLIFLAGALLLGVIGYFYPTKSKRTPLNDRDLRQGDSATWIKKTTGKQ